MKEKSEQEGRYMKEASVLRTCQLNECCPGSAAFEGERLHAMRSNCSFDLEHEPRQPSWRKLSQISGSGCCGNLVLLGRDS